ncbi:MAG: CRTAC1 family protein [Candidatus Latescibacteria bacterium]|nr:CRTAC1 family protein [Candidatus Latescibacterota bacterium]
MRIRNFQFSIPPLSRLLLCLLLSCSQKKSEPKIDPSTYAKPDLGYTRVGARREPPPIAFTDITRQAKLDFHHETGAFGKKWMPETMGSGCAIFDYDGDGLPDIFLVNGTFWPGHEKGGPPPFSRLYRNRGDGTFEDVTERAGLAFPLYGMGVTAGDYDADGDLDLHLTAVGEGRLLRNDGGRFTDVTRKAGVAGRQNPAWSTGAAWVDVDGDGRIDLFVCNYVHWSPETDLFTTIDGVNKSYATPQQYDGATCRLYRNRGDGTFEEITQKAGVDNPKGKSLGVAVADFDDDGRPDLVVTNDTQPNFLYHNQGDGTFRDIALTSGVAYDEAGRARAGMGVDVASLDNDRAIAIAIGNFSREPVSLYRQSGGDIFIDEAGGRRIAQPTLPSLTFGLLFFDCDLDGYLDLALANGHIEPEIQRVQKDISFEQRPQLFWNDRERHFQDVTGRAGEPFARGVVGRGLAAGDLDGDGDLDLVLTASGGPAVLMRNDTPAGKAIRVRLRGAPPNRDALGAVATATAGDLEQRAMARTGSSYLSQSETTLTFGLENRPRVDRLSIRWPDGRTERLENLDAGFTYEIEQGRGIVKRVPFRQRPL